MCLFFISLELQPSGLAHIKSCSHIKSLLCFNCISNQLFSWKLSEDATINPDCVTSPLSLLFWPLTSIVQLQTFSPSPGNTPQVAWVTSSLCNSAPLWLFPAASHLLSVQDGWHPVLVTFSLVHILNPYTCSWRLITTGWSSTWSGRPWRKPARTGLAGSRGGCWPCGRYAGAVSHSPAAPSVPGRSSFSKTGRSPRKTWRGRSRPSRTPGPGPEPSSLSSPHGSPCCSASAACSYLYPFCLLFLSLPLPPFLYSSSSSFSLVIPWVEDLMGQRSEESVPPSDCWDGRPPLLLQRGLKWRGKRRQRELLKMNTYQEIISNNVQIIQQNLQFHFTRFNLKWLLTL